MNRAKRTELEHARVIGFIPCLFSKQITQHELIDDRERFLEMCMSRHWQFEDLKRASYSTMMVLAILGGEPQ